MLVAVTREVSAALDRCELTHQERVPIDVGVAREQHAADERQLAEAGCAGRRLAAGPDMPDSVFVEDLAVVLGEVALVSRPGADSRRVETPAVAEILGSYRPIRRLEAPATADGGDVLVVGRRVFVGRSTRTNAAAAEQMRRMLDEHGYSVVSVEVRGCLHLKSAVTSLGEGALLMNRAWAPAEPFSSFAIVDVDPAEPQAANVLRVGDLIICPSAFPRTRRRIEALRLGARVRAVDVSELAKAEGGVTCCSLVFSQ